MKKSQNKLVWSILTLTVGIFMVLTLVLRAQETATLTQNGEVLLTATNGISAISDLEVELQTIEMTTPLPAVVVTNGSNFYSAQHAPGSEEEWPPLPADVLELPVWPLGDGYYLFDDRNVDYDALAVAQARTARVGGMMPMDDSGGGGFSPLDLLSDTNLWLAITNLENNTAGLLLSNTQPEIQYEVQGKANLTDTQWISAGFVLGAELTNWTPTSVAATNQPTLFLRVRSWADDGSGLPIWWQLQYFGYIGVDPNGDPAGDGWSNIQKFQNGWNPNVFYTPPTPQLNVGFNPSTQTATASWLPSPSPVASYTVEEYNSETEVAVDHTESVGTDEFQDNLSGVAPVLISYRVKAHYAGGDSAWTARVPVPVYESYTTVSLVPGPGNTTYLAATFPPNATGVDFDRVDYFANFNYSDSSFDTNIFIPRSAFTNGLYLLPTYITSSPADGYGYESYHWEAQYTGVASDLVNVSPGWNATEDDSNDWIVQPYFDGRAELKQNLIFKLRAATVDLPFELQVFNPYWGFSSISYPDDYVYSGFYTPDDYEYFLTGGSGTFSSLLPFEENYFFRNYVFNSVDVDSSGNITTGVETDEYHTNIFVHQPPTYQFETPSGTGSTISSLLATNIAQWLCMDPLSLNDPGNNTASIGFSDELGFPGGVPTFIWTLNNNIKNYWGLSFTSAKVYYVNTSGNAVNSVVGAGGSIAALNDGLPVYSATAQPQFATVEYDFWPETYIQLYNDDENAFQNPVPGMNGFSPTNSGSLLITTPGNANFLVSGYAKLAVQNAYSGVYGYLGQYFDKAFMITNGIVTTNTTGILSPLGNFFATQPGPVALVTMPDVDTGARGTATVYAVSLQLDANHDGNMDLSFSGTDATSASNPFQFWCNNNFDRWDYDLLGLTNEQDDVKIATTSDSNYKNEAGYRAIPDTRDLEDFARLWVCGVTSNLLAALPSGSTITLNWGDMGSPNPVNPTIDLFQAADVDGGIGYLTNSTIATQQTNNVQNLYMGRLAPGSSIQLNTIQFVNNWAGNHFIWCGVSNGNGGLNLTIKDANGNLLAQTTANIQISDIKQMYERWTVGDNPNVAPNANAILATEGLPVGASAFQYTSPQDTNTPYILFVHGWNMEVWEKDRFAETTFKRLYWQGYQGRFGSFRWPTYFDFPLGSWSWQAVSLRNFDNSESNSWASGAGLLNSLVGLNSQYPGHVYLIAHSMGNVAAGEALRLAGDSNVVNTYTALQGAIASHAYDSTTPTRALVTGGVNLDSGTPDRYANYWTNGASCYFNSSAGAANYVNFFNTNDWALTQLWPSDQNLKPDNGLNYPGYFYTVSSQHPNGFYVQFGAGTNSYRNLNFPGDTYPIFSFCDEARCQALGAQGDVGGVFATAKQVNLTLPLYGFGPNHTDHSAEFRSDNARRGSFWNTVLVQMRLK